MNPVLLKELQNVDAEHASTVTIPDGEKLTYKSELFEVVVRGKHRHPGITRTRFLVVVELLENDPLIQRTALLEVPEAVWKDIDVGEKAQARLYENPDKTWTPTPAPGSVR